MITQTDRLRLELLEQEDAPFILELHSSPGWLKYIGDRGVKTLENARDYITNGPLKDFESLGHSLFKVSLKSNGASIGLCGLLQREYLDHPDIGFAFLPDYHGQGLALEASRAVLKWASNELGIKTVLAITMAENERSIGLLNKLGLFFDKVVQSPNGADLQLYSNEAVQ